MKKVFKLNLEMLSFLLLLELVLGAYTLAAIAPIGCLMEGARAIEATTSTSQAVGIE